MPNLGTITMQELEDKEDVLAHYGIKGQKWGHRRYQNEDGSLTDEGRARYGKSGESHDSGSKNWKSKDASKLSDEELNRRNSRLQREKQYQDLTTSPLKKEAIAMAKKIFIGTAVGVGVAAMAKNYRHVLDIGAEFLNASGFGHKTSQAIKGKIAAIGLAQILKNTNF